MPAIPPTYLQKVSDSSSQGVAVCLPQLARVPACNQDRFHTAVLTCLVALLVALLQKVLIFCVGHGFVLYPQMGICREVFRPCAAQVWMLAELAHQ